MSSFADSSSERLKRVILQDKLKVPARLPNSLKEELSYVLQRYAKLKSKVIFKVGVDQNGDIDINIYTKAEKLYS